MSIPVQILTIDDCTKDGGEEFLPRCTAFELRTFGDFIRIRLKNTMHLGKRFLATIFSTIVY